MQSFKSCKHIAFSLIPLRAKQVGEFFKSGTKKFHPSLGVCDSVTLWPINPRLSQQPAMGLGRNFFLGPIEQKNMSQIFCSSPQMCNARKPTQKMKQVNSSKMSQYPLAKVERT